MSFWHFLWEMLVVFAFVVWIIIFFQVVFDLFRSHDVSGLGKAGWIILLVILPFLGVLIYLIVRGHGMAERAQKAQRPGGQPGAHPDRARSCRPDRAGQAAARSGGDLPRGVRRDQKEGHRVISLA